MEVLADHPLRALNTLGVDVRARRFVRACTIDGLREALAFARAECLDVLVLGGGSNVVLTRDFPGLVVRIELGGLEPLEQTDRNVLLRAAGGEDWPSLVQHCLARGWYGLENLSGIPGSAGAAPIQNIGAYGVELKDRLVELEALERDSGQLVRLSNSACCFGYRESVFKRAYQGRYVIVAITLRLDREPAPVLTYEALARKVETLGRARPTPRDISRAVLELRERRLPDPAVLGNVGSFFKNPTLGLNAYRAIERRFAKPVAHPTADGRMKLSAGWMIETCGFGGFRTGAAGVFSEHALVLVNHGGASGRDIVELAERIRRAVEQRFGVRLEIEPRVY